MSFPNFVQHDVCAQSSCVTPISLKKIGKRTCGRDLRTLNLKTGLHMSKVVATPDRRMSYETDARVVNRK